MKYLVIASCIAIMIFESTVIKLEAKGMDLEKDMPASKHLNSVVLGAGCFWGAEKRYAAIEGVVDAVSGYADGFGIEPTYDEITKSKHKSNPKNHAEVVKVTYNELSTNIETILRHYFEGHDPTQVNGQGNDIGTQYRSTILTNSAEQVASAQKILKQYQNLLSAKGYGKIATQIKPLSTFFPAEEYHQDYLVKNPQGYCPNHSTGIKFVADKQNKVVDNSALTTGQHIVIIESEHCSFCDKFKADVTADYTKKTPLHFRRANELTGLTLKTATWATPTILFLEQGKEVFGHQGYMSAEQFYKAYSRLKFH